MNAEPSDYFLGCCTHREPPATVFVGFWLPKKITRLLDRAVRKKDTDRSKYVREAVREKLGVAV